jgi:hypothetical protein
MSRIGSSSTSGVRIAAEPLSNVYTVLLLIGLVALVVATVMLWVTLEQRYGVTFGLSEAGKRALAAPEAARNALSAARADLQKKTEDEIVRFPEEMGKTAPGAAPTPPAEVTPTPPAPAAPGTPPPAEGGTTPPAPPAAPAA